MDYKKIYFQLVRHRKDFPAEGYVENHHVIPRSLGGSDDVDNLAPLTAREHWIAHLLLHKIHNTPQTLYACSMMAMAKDNRDIRQIKNSRLYKMIREQVSKERSKANKLRKGKKYKLNPKNNHEYKCYFCHNYFTRRSRARRDLYYCSKSCSMKGNNQNIV